MHLKMNSPTITDSLRMEGESIVKEACKSDLPVIHRRRREEEKEGKYESDL